MAAGVLGVCSEHARSTPGRGTQKRELSRRDRGLVRGLPRSRQLAPQIKRTPAVAHVGISGKETFAAYCAVCHGATARGDGPAAPALKMPVPDLTTMAARHGTFDAIALERTITGVDKMPVAHGTVTMPIWGPIFVATGDRTTAALRAQNVVDYLKSLQAKS